MILYHGSTIFMLPQDYPHTPVLSGYFYDKKKPALLAGSIGLFKTHKHNGA
ncbi:hypothetical protein WCU81_03640 [Pectobacterium atrosepticum]|uniref:hypothetical protein n=1 Tax=Pectobacterium atrosepticum TaxID=29471 RepID=UPI00039EADFD|nr:hypothetical protein [Pectobacterium atrosepticum]MBL0895702.1 hypothetical protein [Pectobacterium atrosepticum]MCA6979016.1 hypothetical protein [Pectobacterium atrosepticum]MCH5020209.1 hypothetical protein [Pectobacterium atrosepticum]MDK9442644.1 hypothetical protein [Pectobacterium atrosepticum]QWC51152.1 hypothetical protein HLB43_10595 [Pectobacterium atrosepticum]